ncbi:hypothetical protein Ocin01_03828 [Orchesella cincta]|uniref:C2H2-type domain-containing protein n=1 Tax=Orchesella cincta TaxID=48709 RepID=A0A1D2NCN3_ORCCI|nr:hypothetical protein Ocin01_03828 [Orchesella cincta]
MICDTRYFTLIKLCVSNFGGELKVEGVWLCGQILRKKKISLTYLQFANIRIGKKNTNMASAVAPKRGSSTKKQNAPASSSLEQHLKEKFFILEGDDDDADSSKSTTEGTDPDEVENLFQPFSFDFEDVWDRVSAELKEFGADDYAQVRSEILSAHRGTTSIGPLTFRMNEEELLDGLFDDDLFPIPPLDDLKDLIGSTISSQAQSRRNGDEAADTKQVNRDVPARKSNESDTQYVFVEEISTNQTKVLCLKKGEEVPEGFELTSIRSDVDSLPPELASFPKDALEEAILGAAGTTSKSAPSSPAKISPTSRSSSRASMGDKRSSPTSGLMSLADYMRAEKQKEKPQLVYKQRSSNAHQKVVSILNKTMGDSTNNEAARVEDADSPSGVDIVPITTDAAEQNSNVALISYPAAKSKQVANNRNNTGSVSTVKSSTPVAAASNLPPPDPIGIEEVSSTSSPVVTKKVAAFLGCKKCGDTFPISSDNLFRKHVLIRHDEEIAENDTTVFESSKLSPKDLRRCKKCNFMVINKFEEHQMKCLPFVSVEAAFEPVDKNSTDSLSRLECGLCPNRYTARYELKEHVDKNHAQLSKKIILDPEYRCASCLKRFDESVALMRHCAICTDRQPRPETILELAKSAADCDICSKKHPTIEETLCCYLRKNYRRCMFCFAVFQGKNYFYRHLHQYHSLQMCSTTKQYRVPCPICPTGTTERISQISHHMVTKHFAHMLSTTNQSLPMPPPINAGTTQKQQQGTSVSVPSKKLPLPPLRTISSAARQPTSINLGAPPGIVINTSRLNNTVRFTPTAPLSTTTVRQIQRPAHGLANLTVQRNAQGQMVLLPIVTSPATTPPVSANIIRTRRTSGTMTVGSVAGSVVRRTSSASPQVTRAGSPPTPTIVSVTSSAPRVVPSGTSITPSTVQATTTTSSAPPTRVVKVDNRGQFNISFGNNTRFVQRQPIVGATSAQTQPRMVFVTKPVKSTTVVITPTTSTNSNSKPPTSN